MMKPPLYPLLDAPIPVPLKAMTPRQGKEYLNWFLENRDRRIAILLDHLGIDRAETVPEMEGALLVAAEWLRNHGYREPLNPEAYEQRKRELGERYAGLADVEEISDETVAFCYDMSFLLGKIFKSYLPDFDYMVRLGDKRNVDYGHIVLAKKGKVDLNPFGLCRIMSYDAIDGMLKDEVVLKTIRTNVQYSL